MVIPRTQCPRIILQLEKHISARDAALLTILSSLVPAGPRHRGTYYNGYDVNLWKYLDRGHLGEDKRNQTFNAETEERGGKPEVNEHSDCSTENAPSRSGCPN